MSFLFKNKFYASLYLLTLFLLKWEAVIWVSISTNFHLLQICKVHTICVYRLVLFTCLSSSTYKCVFECCQLVSPHSCTPWLNLTLFSAFIVITNIATNKRAVPPAYYAHLAAFRARFYMEPETSDSGSMISGPAAGQGGMGGSAGPRSTRAPVATTAVRPLPALKENVKRVMFYC